MSPPLHPCRLRNVSSGQLKERTARYSQIRDKALAVRVHVPGHVPGNFLDCLLKDGHVPGNVPGNVPGRPGLAERGRRTNAAVQ